MHLEWLGQGKIDRLVVVISRADTKETLEKWDFIVEGEKGFGSKDEGKE